MSELIQIGDKDEALWDFYIEKHPQSSVYHKYTFRKVIEHQYHHQCMYLMLKKDDSVKGVLPLFKIPSPLTGKTIVSLPFCDYGGILADTPEDELILVDEALKICTSTGMKYVELRQTSEISYGSSVKPGVISSKMRLIAPLAPNPDEQFNSFPAKLRSQIRKPSKEGCTIADGTEELLDDFYKVFSYNMRDLGSPVHSKRLLKQFVQEYGKKARVFVVYKDGIPIAGAIVAGFRDSLVNPWASFDKRYRPIAPNMLLYWGMLEWAINNGYRTFDFGRSTRDEGTFKFKLQWGAQPQQLFWYYFSLDGIDRSIESESKAKAMFLMFWQKLPVPLTVMLGPTVRRLIPL